MSNKSFGDLLEEFHENHEVEYQLVAVVDGEVIAKQTSSMSADDVSGFAWTIDREVERHVIDEANDKAEYDREAAAEEQLQNELDEKAE